MVVAVVPSTVTVIIPLGGEEAIMCLRAPQEAIEVSIRSVCRGLLRPPVCSVRDCGRGKRRVGRLAGTRDGHQTSCSSQTSAHQGAGRAMVDGKGGRLVGGRSSHVCASPAINVSLGEIDLCVSGTCAGGAGVIQILVGPGVCCSKTSSLIRCIRWYVGCAKSALQ